MCAVSSSSTASLDASIPPGSTGGVKEFHLVLLAFGILGLITGLCGALWRLGWTLPHGSSLAAIHGPLMISGVFGMLISLERAVAHGGRWAYSAPVLAGIGSLALVVGAPMEFGASAYAAAAAALAGGSLSATIRQPGLPTGALLFGALAWLAGNVLWLVGMGGADAAGWWLTFLIVTIAGERMQLNASLPQRRGSEALFLFAGGLLIVGARNGLPTGNGTILYGIALLVTAVWFLRHDVARLDVRGTGQDRFTAACMLAGYAWLAAAGLVLTASPSDVTFGYDVTLHAVLVGFVLSTVFGHAPIILPTLARIRVQYVPFLYVPLLLLHGSVALRVGGGLVGWDAGRKGSGLLTLVALGTFAVGLVISRLKDRGLSDAADHVMTVDDPGLTGPGGGA
jgi:hypothetical protein